MTRLLLADSSTETLVWRLLLAALIVCVVFRCVAIPVFAKVWSSALVFLPIAGALSGMTTSVFASSAVAVQLALLIALSPFVLKFFAQKSRLFTWFVGGCFVVSQSFSAVVGLLQIMGETPFDTATIFGRATGLSTHPNVLGIMSVLALVACAASFHYGRTCIRVASLFLGMLNLIALVNTGSLSSMLAAAVALLAFLLIRRRVLLFVITCILGSAVFVFSSLLVGLDISGLTDPVTSRVEVVTGVADFAGGAASISTRVLTYEWAWVFISNNPLVGVGMDATNAGTYNGYTPVHNYILHAWYRGGLFFFAWQICVTVSYVLIASRAIRNGSSAFAVSLISGVVAFAATSAFYDRPEYWLPLLFGVALIPSGTPGAGASAANEPTDTRALSAAMQQGQLKASA